MSLDTPNLTAKLCYFPSYQTGFGRLLTSSKARDLNAGRDSQLSAPRTSARAASERGFGFSAVDYPGPRPELVKFGLLWTKLWRFEFAHFEALVRRFSEVERGAAAASPRR